MKNVTLDNGIGYATRTVCLCVCVRENDTIGCERILTFSESIAV